MSCLMEKLTNASQMSTSVPPSLSWLSHPSLPAPTSTYHPTATLPISDQHLSSLTSLHTSMHNQNPTTHPTKQARRESSDSPLPTPTLPNMSLNMLLYHLHAPNPARLQFYPSTSNPIEEAT